MEEWNVFTCRWRLFKEGSGMNGESTPSQLFQCTTKVLGDNLLEFDAKIAIRSIEGLTKSMRRLAVIPIATDVLRTELVQMCQMRDESGHLPLEYVEKLTHVLFLLTVLVV